MRDTVGSIVSKMLAPIRRSIVHMVVRGVVELVKEDTTLRSLQLALRADQTVDDIEHFEPYGFTSRAAAGAECIVLHVGGNGDHPVCIVVADRRTRPQNIAEGEVALWTKDHGKRFHAKANGECHVGTNPVNKAARDDRVEAELSALRTNMITNYTAIATAISNLGGSYSKTDPSAINDVGADEVLIK